MLLQALAFYVFAFVVMASAAMVVVSRNPVYSVLFLILAFFNAAALFLLIGAEFIAMILVIVYVGAVAVLFLFVVMMLDINLTKLREGFLKYLPIGAMIGVVLFAEILFGLGVLGGSTATLAGARPRRRRRCWRSTTRGPSAACSTPSTSTSSRWRAWCCWSP